MFPKEALAVAERIATDYFKSFKTDGQPPRPRRSAKAPTKAPSQASELESRLWIGFGIETDKADRWRGVLYVRRDEPAVKELVDRISKSIQTPVEARVTGKYRPLGAPVAGSSVGAAYVDPDTGRPAGTFGAVVRKGNSAQKFLLSCNHILYLNREVILPPGTSSERILQPALSGTRIGMALDDQFFRLAAPPATNRGDWALARLSAPPTVWWPSNMPALSQDQPVDPLTLGPNEQVFKVGAATGKTSGHLVGGAQGFSLAYPEFSNAFFHFEHQLRIESAGPGPFAVGGDSGSLVVTATGAPVGLVFATDDAGTLVCPLGPLFSRLGLKFDI